MKKSRFHSPHLLAIKGMLAEDIEVIFQAARNFKGILQGQIKKVPSLRDTTIVNLFFENSTRTRISFELAEKRLSADVINFSASTSSVSKGETLLDTVNNILAMKVDMVVIRHPNPGAAHFLSRKVDANIINAGDGTHEHPTQGLLDCFSLVEKFGTLKGLKVAIIGDILHSRVALSNVYALKILGAEVRVCGPKTLIPRYYEATGAEVSYDFEDTLRWADAVNMLRIQLERQELEYVPSIREYCLQYQLNEEILEKTGKSPVILHPGPINRGVEITSGVADSKNSLILNQVENGVAIRMAVLYLLGAGE